MKLQSLATVRTSPSEPTNKTWSRGLRWGLHRGLCRVLRDDTGSATAEYAIATMAAVGFAGMLVVILRGDEVRTILTDLVRRALTFAG